MPLATLKSAALSLHRVVARSDALSRVYLEQLGNLSRAMLPAYAAVRVHNSVRAASFSPSLPLRARRVALGDGVGVRVHPHVGEFDLEGLFSRTLVYERDTMRFLGARMARYGFVFEIGAKVGI